MRYSPADKPAPFRPWKTERCECGAPHPSFSRDGMEGPWRCRACDLTAQPKPPDPLNRPGPAPKHQTALL